MRRGLLIIGILTLAVTTAVMPARAQTPASGEPQASGAVNPPAAPGPFDRLHLGVTLEGYYAYNTNRPYDRISLLRAYDTRANVFGIQQVGLVIEHAPDPSAGRRFGARVDLQFGQATSTVQGNPANEPRPETYRPIWQAYGSYVADVGRGLRIDFGKFASNLGLETNYAKDNAHFSRAYLFNFLPFYHSGLRLTLPLDGRLTVMYALTNGIQQTEDFNDFKSQQLSATLAPRADLSWTTSLYWGREQPNSGESPDADGLFRVVDTQVAFAPRPRLSVALDANWTRNQFRTHDPPASLQGLGAYLRYQAGSRIAIALRYERLDDDGLFGGVAQRLHEVTGTLEHAVADGFLVRGELRRDASNVPFFTGANPEDRRRTQVTLLAGLIWWFGNKTGTW